MIKEKFSKPFENCILWNNDCMTEKKPTKPFANCISWSNDCMVEENPTEPLEFSCRGVKIIYIPLDIKLCPVSVVMN